MSPKLRAEITQLSIKSGTEQANAGDTGLWETSPVIPPGNGKGNLYVLVQVSGEPVGREAIHEELVQVICEEYSRVPGGVTNGLRQAIRAANSFLHQRNLGSLPLWQRVGATCCAVLRGSDLFMGVAGEAHICVLRQGDVRLFPSRGSDAFRDDFVVDQQPLPPLGVDEYLTDVGLFHCAIEEGDLIILASSGLSQIARVDEVAEASQGGLEELADALSSLASHTDLSALLIEVRAEESAAVPQRELRLPRFEALPSRARPVRPADEATPTPRIPAKGIAAGLVALVLAIAARILAFFAGVARGIQLFFSWLFSSGLLGKLGRGARAGLLGLLEGVGTLTTRMLPESGAITAGKDITYGQRTRRIAEQEKGSRLPLVFVLLIVFAVAAVSIGTVMRSQSRQSQFSRHVEAAQSSMQLAATSDATVTTREHLQQARESIGLALELKPGNAEASALQEEILLALDEVNRAVRLQFSARVAFPDPLDRPERALFHEDRVYVLDGGSQRLYGYALDETGGIPEAPGGGLLLSLEEQTAGIDATELIDFAWIEAGSGRETGALLVLANGGTILELDESLGFVPVSVADTEVWHDPRVIAGYSGYLYVLDAQDDRILKYAPTGNSYDSFPISYFQADTVVDLEGALDMAIDGYIYILVNKSILRFSGGLQEEYSLSGMEGHELENPVAIFASPDAQHVYVADAGAGRIVQLNKEGAFVRQFLPPRDDGDVFSTLRDVSVDEVGGRLIVLTSEGLFVSPIQQPPSTIQ